MEPSASRRLETRGRRAAALGLIVNVLLAAAKLIAGLAGNSYALVTDAAESIADILGSAVIWGGLHYSARPADERHPYGHGKAESLAALAVAAMLLVAGLGLAIEALRRIIDPGPPPEPFTLAALAGVVLVKETLARLVARVGRQAGSTALASDAAHHRADAITSLAAAIGITVALIGGPAYAAADGWAALLASLIIVYNAARLARTPYHELMDAEPTEIVEQARALAAAVPLVRDVEKVMARKSGPNYWLDMHVRVDPAMTVRDAHAVAHAVKDQVRAAMPDVRDVLIHIEPGAAPAAADLAPG